MQSEYDYRNINFGKTDAQLERSRYPELLISGFINQENIVGKVLNGDTFLFLGYKGSGKTALSEHLELTQESFKCHIDKVLMRDFPYRSFATAMLPGESPEVQTSMAWRWLLYTRVFDNLLDDQSARTTREEDVHSLSELLRKTGLMHPRSVTDFASKTITKDFRIKLGDFFEYESGNNNVAETSFVDVINLLREIISSFSTERRLILSIDGLDDILIADEIQYIAIGTLFTEVNDLNAFFASLGLPIKVIVFCRTDILGKIPNTNKNKIIQDLSHSFNWFEQGVDYKQCSLIKIGNLRTQLVYPEIRDSIGYFFPRTISHKPAEQALLEFTRHTPRDFLQVLIKIQAVCVGNKVSYSDFNKGIADYSTKYFLGEIKDELVGYVDYDRIDSVFTLLSSLHRMQFSFDDVVKAASLVQSFKKEDLLFVFKILFECSAIGNVYQYTDGNYRFTFKYRNPIAAFNPNERITIHKGLWKALNLNF